MSITKEQNPDFLFSDPSFGTVVVELQFSPRGGALGALLLLPPPTETHRQEQTLSFSNTRCLWTQKQQPDPHQIPPPLLENLSPEKAQELEMRAHEARKDGGSQRDLGGQKCFFTQSSVLGSEDCVWIWN
ncbi:hypothetical protein ACFX15_022546 [Malus domestica]